MKMVKSLILGSAAGLIAVSGAQAADLPVKAKAVEYVKSVAFMARLLLHPRHRHLLACRWLCVHRNGYNARGGSDHFSYVTDRLITSPRSARMRGHPRRSPRLHRNRAPTRVAPTGTTT
jgi:hypothetical protein